MRTNVQIVSALILSIYFATYFSFFPPAKTVVHYENPAELVLDWGVLGQEMVRAGVIDAKAMERLHDARGQFGEYEKELLYGDAELAISKSNADFALNLLWALGLGNKNKILENGPMVKNGLEYAGNFASTGGWTIARGNAMEHYSAHRFIKLSTEEQSLVERVSQNIFRPCCGNATHFPDCNHGMAMLGLLELMASQGKTEKEMYGAALLVNSLWFSSEYENIGKYFEMENISKDSKAMLSAEYSSSQGYRKVLSKVVPLPNKGGASCGV